MKCLNENVHTLGITSNTILGKNDQVITFISRNLEPMRDSEFMRALPHQKEETKHTDVIVGGDGVIYSNRMMAGRGKKYC